MEVETIYLVVSGEKARNKILEEGVGLCWYFRKFFEKIRNRANFVIFL